MIEPQLVYCFMERKSLNAIGPMLVFEKGESPRNRGISNLTIEPTLSPGLFELTTLIMWSGVGRVLYEITLSLAVIPKSVRNANGQGDGWR